MNTASTAVRAGAGLHLSTYVQSGNASGAASVQMDSRDAAAQAQASHQLQQTLADTAQQHKAQLSGEPAPEKLPAIAAAQNSADVLQSSQSGAGGSGQNTVTAYSTPQLQLSSPAGIAALTPHSAILSAGQTSSYSAGHDINLAAQGSSHHLVKGGISLFTYGKASEAQKPNQETGIRLHAASGRVSVQSQSGPTSLTADKAITVASVSSSITVASPQKILLTAGGAGITIEGGNITLAGPGTMAFNGSLKELAGPGSVSAGSLILPNGELELPAIAPSPRSVQWQAHNGADGKPKSGVPYELVHQDKTVLTGKTSGTGQTERHLAEQDYGAHEVWMGASGWAIGVEACDHSAPVALDDQLYDLQNEHDSEA